MCGIAGLWVAEGRIDLGRLHAPLGEVLAPFRSATRLLTTMPGVSDIVAQVQVAEVGTDMARFPTSGHLISWAGLCLRKWSAPRS